MYAKRKIYVKNRDFMTEEEKTKITVKSGKNTERIDESKISYIIEDAMYWRKANAIHQWFVENVQDGNDDCGDYYVCWGKLEKLLELVNKVLEWTKIQEDRDVASWTRHSQGKTETIYEKGRINLNPEFAASLLPTSRWFFFWSTEYDERYLSDLEDTKKRLEEELKEKRGDIYYTSSW